MGKAKGRLKTVKGLLYLCMDDNRHAVANLELMTRQGIRPEWVIVLCDNKAKPHVRMFPGSIIRMIRFLRGQTISGFSDREKSREWFGADVNEKMFSRSYAKMALPRHY